MQIVNRQSKIANGSWLPDMDLNHDKQIQSLLCYRYTIGQAGAFGKLEGLSAQSSRRFAGLSGVRDALIQPFQGYHCWWRLPRVARSSQPWAERFESLWDSPKTRVQRVRSAHVSPDSNYFFNQRQAGNLSYN